MSRYFPAYVFSLLVFLSTAYPPETKKPTTADPSAAGKKAVTLAKSGHCKEALPGLKKAALHTVESSLRREAGFSGVRCAMSMGDTDAAIDFLRFLKREFPRDPDVLYVMVHTYSDASTRASLELAQTAPASVQAHQLNAESLEVQGKWDEAEKEYRQVLTQNPRQP